MKETRHLISEAARLVQVEPYVLRYWEEELLLPIGRNEMGHRYYTEKNIQTFLNVKELKKQGMPLKKIREQLGQTTAQEDSETKTAPDCQEKERSEKAVDMEKSREELFLEIMDRLIQELEQNEEKENRFRRLDKAIRQRQQTRRMAAATEEQVYQRQRRFLAAGIKK